MNFAAAFPTAIGSHRYRHAGFSAILAVKLGGIHGEVLSADGRRLRKRSTPARLIPEAKRMFKGTTDTTL